MIPDTGKIRHKDVNALTLQDAKWHLNKFHFNIQACEAKSVLDVWHFSFY